MMSESLIREIGLESLDPCEHIFNSIAVATYGAQLGTSRVYHDCCMPVPKSASSVAAPPIVGPRGDRVYKAMPVGTLVNFSV
jgi:hypothetical protein